MKAPRQSWTRFIWSGFKNKENETKMNKQKRKETHLIIGSGIWSRWDVKLSKTIFHPPQNTSWWIKYIWLNSDITVELCPFHPNPHFIVLEGKAATVPQKSTLSGWDQLEKLFRFFFVREKLSKSELAGTVWEKVLFKSKRKLLEKYNNPCSVCIWSFHNHSIFSFHRASLFTACLHPLHSQSF